MEITIKSEGEINQVIDALHDAVLKNKIIFLYGDLGAGKTTFVKNFLMRLGTEDIVSSPTYSIVNEYIVAKQKTAYHIDLYRLEGEGDALDIGIEEYLHSGDFIFIEWPQIIERLVDNYLEVKISVDNDGGRTFSISEK